MKIHVGHITKLLKRILLSILLGILIYLLLSIILSIIPSPPKKLDCIKEHDVFVSTNGVHLNIIIKSDDLPFHLKEQLEVQNTTPYTAFGWGDQGFYLHTPTWGDLKLSIAFKALFMKSETAMHVIRYPRKFPSWREVKICKDQLEALIKFIERSFVKDDQGLVVKIDFEGYSAYDDFYEGIGSYTLFYTCNNWVNEALKKAEVKTAVWSPFDKGVLYHIQN